MASESVKQEMVVDEAIVEGRDSPPLTSSLFSRNSASSARESAYLRQATILRWVRLGLSVLSVGMALAIVGCSGHVLYSYNQTKWGMQQLLPIWPANVDVRPTLGTMIPSIIVVVSSLVYVLFALIPSPHSRTLRQVLLFGASSLVASIALLFAVFFKQLLLYYFDANDLRDNLQSWTCGFYYGARDYAQSGNATEVSIGSVQLVPNGFKRVCMESQAGQWMTVTLFVVELICCGVAVQGLLAEKNIRKSRAMRYESNKCESEFQ